MNIDKLLGGHGINLGLHVLPADTLTAIKECTIPLPVRPEHQSRVDEKYEEHGHGSLDQRMGTDWNQSED